jgi:hypothetical protein
LYRQIKSNLGGHPCLQVLQPFLSPSSELHKSELAGAEEDLRLMIYKYFLSPERFEGRQGILFGPLLRVVKDHAKILQKSSSILA